MANIASARKRARQAIGNRERNMALRNRLRTYVKKVLAHVQAGDANQAQAAYNEAVPYIDSAVNKGLVHKNKAARDKSRLNAKVRALNNA